MEAKTRYYKKIRFLDIIQYFIAGFIGIAFLLWLLPQSWNLIPASYPPIQRIVIGGLVIQAIISILRLRVMGLFLELFLLLLALLSLIPYAGYFFRFLGLVFILVELATFQSYEIYQHVERQHPSKAKEEKTEKEEEKTSEKSINKKQIKDADFEEK